MVRRHIRLASGSCGEKITLLVTGFGEQSLVSTDEIVEALSQPPAAHLAGLKEIRYDPGRAYPLSLVYAGLTAGRSRCMGEFVSEERVIFIYEFESRDRCFSILYHELGHYVFGTVLDSKRRKEWVTRLYPRSRHVSDYARRNAQEDFAESYAAYLLEPSKLQAIPAKHTFMWRHVFTAG